MANVIHRTTLEFTRSVNTPDFPEPTWKHNPDMSAVAGVAFRYWKWDSGAERPVEMTQAEKDAVDAAETTAEENAIMADIDAKTLTQALALAILDEINLHATRTTAILDAIDRANSLGDVKTAIGAIDVPTRTVAQLKTAIRNKLEALNGG